MDISSKPDDFLVSTIIPTHNRLRFLPRALESVLSQTHQVGEIIVIDDGSTDRTVEILSPQYPSVRFIEQTNLGVSIARNTGITHARCPWVGFLDSDDKWEPTKIEKQVSYLSQNPGLKAIHTGEKWIRNGQHVNTPAFLDKSMQGLFERSLERCIICPSSVVLHSSVFEKIGLFDPALTVCEDYDYWLRLLLHFDIGYVDEQLVEKHGGHEDQLSTSTWGLDRFRVQSLEKILTKEKLGEIHKVKILEFIAKKTDLLSRGFQKHKKEKEALDYVEKKVEALRQISALTGSISS